MNCTACGQDITNKPQTYHCDIDEQNAYREKGPYCDACDMALLRAFEHLNDITDDDRRSDDRHRRTHSFHR